MINNQTPQLNTSEIFAQFKNDIWSKPMKPISNNTNTNILQNIQNSEKKIEPQPKTNIVEQDTFEKENTKKDKKKKIIIAASIAIGVALAILAFIKRKQIGDFFSNLFKKKPKNPPSSLDTPNVPKGSDLPPVSGNNRGIVPPPLPTGLQGTLTSDLAKIQKELDPSIDTTKMSFGDLAYLLEKKIRSDETPQALKRQWSDTIEKAKAENVSFIPNIKITSDDLADTIIDKTRKTINRMSKNEASALDGLKWLQENGHFAKDLNFSPYENTTSTLLDDVTCSLRILRDNGQMTNTVLDKYIDIYNKFVKSWTSYGFVDGDAANLEILFSENAKTMNKDIAFKFLEALEKTGLHNGQAYQFKLDSQDLKLDDKSRKEFLNRIEILLKKLPDYKNSN